jgi:hypothetical protein
MEPKQEDRNIVMAEYVLQANFKVGQHLINVIGANQEDFKANLQWVTSNAAGVVAAGAALEAAYGVKALAPNVTSVSVSNERPTQAAPQASGAPGPSCKHGPMKLVPAGVSKNTGNSYNAFYSCTAPRADQCKSQNS